MEIDEEDIDVFALEDVCDIGDGRPLFMHFLYEDWTLLSLRYEMHLLVHSFRRDVNDPDRPGFHESHLHFYFDKYFRKSFNPKHYGFSNLEDVLALIKDSATLNPTTKFVEAVLPEDAGFDKFLRHTEDHRRERQRCIDAGDETAQLKFSRPSPPPPLRQPQGGSGGSHQMHRGGSGGHYRGSGNSRGPPQDGRSNPPRAYDSSGGGGSRGGSGGYSSRGGGYGSPAGGSQKRPYPPPTGSGYPPSKHQRSGYGSAPPPREGGGSGGGGSRYGQGAPGGRSGYGGGSRGYR